MAHPTTAHRAGDVVRAVGLAVWLVVAFLAPWQTAVDGASSAVTWTAATWGWVGWTAVTVAFLVPTPPSLTAVRIVAPVAFVASCVARDPVSAAASVLVVAFVLHPILVDRMAQGGAYGREIRFSLRTPVPHMAPALLVWAILVGTCIGGSLLVAARNLPVGIPVLVVGAVLAARTPRRLHLLARRWLVVVPAGIVVHDHLVLGETFMVRRPNVARLDIEESTGESADLTGGVLGRRIVVSLVRADKVILSDFSARMLGTSEALHVQSFAVAPRRIDAALATLG